MSQKFFDYMCDELVQEAENDPELKESLQWLDRLAQRKGMSFNKIVFLTLNKQFCFIKSQPDIIRKLHHE